MKSVRCYLGRLARVLLALGVAAGITHGAIAATNKHVMIIVMENRDSTQIYGNTSEAPYINTRLLPHFAHTLNFADILPKDVSEPHYILMEAGTTSFSDKTFHGDDDPSSSNSTSSTQHLVSQIAKAKSIDWMSYQQSMSDVTGLCPIKSNGFYAAKHDPFVFFQDVAGDPPSKTNAYCMAHHRNFKRLGDDILHDRIPAYSFVTPNLCNDMHGANGCPVGSNVTRGDTWLRRWMPAIIAWSKRNAGVVFIVWDESKSTSKIPFIAVGPSVKKNYVNNVLYDHGSLLKTIEQILGVPVLPAVASKTALSDLFLAGQYP